MPRPKTGSRGASRADAVEWVGGRFRPPYFIEDRDEPYRAELALWLELPSGLVVGQALLAPEEIDGAVGRALRLALERPLAGPPRRPGAIRLADPALEAEVRAEVGHGVPIRIAPTPELDALLEEMLDALPPSDDEESYLANGRIPAAAVAKLFAAAAGLFRAAPWKRVEEGQLLRMDVPALGVEGACLSIIGQLGESFGVLVFPSLLGFESFCSAAEAATRETPPRDLGTDWLALEFVRGADLPASQRREVASHAWPVAGANAYPEVTRHDRDGAERPLALRDVEIATACAAALTALFAKHRRTFREEFDPISESYPVGDDREVHLALPYEAFGLFEAESPAAAPAPAASPPSQGPKPSRNAPCPCGSGRKYKKCCMARQEQAGARHPFQDLDDRLVRALMGFAAQRFGSAWLRTEEFASDEPSILQIAVPWSLYHHRADGRTVLERYLEERWRRLSPAERACLEAQSAAWLSVWEVTEVEPGERVTLRDLLSGEARVVRERTASRSMARRDAVLARVVDADGVSLICGMHPRPLSPFAAAEVVRRARAKLRRKGPVPVARLREESCCRHLIRRWEEAVAGRGAGRARPTRLTNTDGDPFLLTTDHFEIAPGMNPAVQEALAGIPDARAPEPGDASPEWVFLRPGNRMHKSWDNTIVGRAWITGDLLHVETNSRARADALREEIETACGDHVRHRAREHGDPLSDAAPRGRARPPEPPPAEAEQLLLEFKQQHYAGWLDEPIPALRGRTPRQAVRTAEGRAALDVLLKEIENTEQRSAQGAPFDVSALRRELGLDEGGGS